MCDRISLARVTLRIDSPWPVQDTAPLLLSAYPPQPGLHRRHAEIMTMRIRGKHLPAQLLLMVKSSHRTDNGRVSNSADHFISDPSGGGRTGNVAGRVNSNRSYRIMGPAGGSQKKAQHNSEDFWSPSRPVSLHLLQSKLNSAQFLPLWVEILPHSCHVAPVFLPLFPLVCRHQRVSGDGGHADALSKQVGASAGQQQMGRLEYSGASNACFDQQEISLCWRGVTFSITARARETGLGMFFTDDTAPLPSVRPSMMIASSSTSPSAFSTAPWP